MKYIFLFLLNCIFYTSSLEIEPKLCKNCKFFTKQTILTPNQFGKCMLFTQNKESDFLVDGIHRINITKYCYCSTARNYDYMCGKDGKSFEQV